MSEEAGSIPMTDARVASGRLSAVELRAGIARPSTGYADSRYFPHHVRSASGALTIRFLTERSTILDELRLIAVLPKRWLLRAAFTTASERIDVHRRCSSP